MSTAGRTAGEPVKVTVLIPAYNEAGTIIECLQSVNAQVVDGVEFEVLVVDDGSSDATPDLLAALPARLHDICTRSAARDPDAPAITEPDGRTWSYGELKTAVDAAAEEFGVDALPAALVGGPVAVHAADDEPVGEEAPETAVDFLGSHEPGEGDVFEEFVLHAVVTLDGVVGGLAEEHELAVGEGALLGIAIDPVEGEEASELEAGSGLHDALEPPVAGKGGHQTQQVEIALIGEMDRGTDRAGFEDDIGVDEEQAVGIGRAA